MLQSLGHMGMTLGGRGRGCVLLSLLLLALMMVGMMIVGMMMVLIVLVSLAERSDVAQLRCR